MSIKIESTYPVRRSIIEIGLLVMIYFISYFLSLNYNFMASLIMIVGGISYYFYFSLSGEPSFLKLKAVFSGVWLSTIGLATLRFLEYQVPWGGKSWLIVCISHVFFLIANDLSKIFFPYFENKFDLRKMNDNKFPLRYKPMPQRLFWVATVATIIGVISFLINVYIKGFIPFFVSDTNPNAYFEFYTRFHTFVVASMITGGLAYYIIKKCDVSRLKKMFLYLYIIVLVFVLPIFLVQRGTFINAALILTAIIYLMSNRKFRVLLTCILVIFGVYLFGSNLRGYSDAQLNEFFKPKEIVNDTIEKTDSNKTNSQDHANTEIDLPISKEQKSFKLPPQGAFLYSYLTVSHDNFNLAIEKNTVHTWGIWQLKPFNVILRSDWIEEKLLEAELNSQQHRVLPYLNSFNLITRAFYDFGIIGVILFISLWSFGFGLVEVFNNKYKGVFSMLAYGVCLLPVALCFFDPWMSNFTTWLFWGTIFLMFSASSFTCKERRK